ncbi:hypothetical protein HDG33_001472 [Paraburkholderia sp. Cpub6]|nr:hypothetical protein [Paraburkholderia sp. Cpub6]
MESGHVKYHELIAQCRNLAPMLLAVVAVDRVQCLRECGTVGRTCCIQK